MKEFSNYVGISIGVLFSSSNTDEGKDNIFAVGVSFLDLKVAYGYELGDRPEGIRNGFFTIAYGIPLTKLAGKSGYILRNLSKNPAQLDTKFF